MCLFISFSGSRSTVGVLSLELDQGAWFLRALHQSVTSQPSRLPCSLQFCLSPQISPALSSTLSSPNQTINVGKTLKAKTIPRIVLKGLSTAQGRRQRTRGWVGRKGVSSTQKSRGWREVGAFKYPPQTHNQSSHHSTSSFSFSCAHSHTKVPGWRSPTPL